MYKRQVQALDAAGNVATGFTGDVVLEIATGPLAGTITTGATVTAVAGEATFGDVRLDSAGTYELRATSSGLTSVVSTSFVITAPVATLGDVAALGAVAKPRVAGIIVMSRPAGLALSRRPAA